MRIFREDSSFPYDFWLQSVLEKPRPKKGGTALQCKFSRLASGTLVCLTHREALQQTVLTDQSGEVTSSTLFCPVSLRVLATTGLPSRLLIANAS